MTRKLRLFASFFDFYTSEHCSGLGGLLRELYRRDIRTRSGSNKWSQSMVARIISNESYIGTTYWGKFKAVEDERGNGYRRLLNTKRVRRPKEEWLPIPVPKIIDEALFRKAEYKRATNKSLSPNKVKNNYLLRGIMEHSCGAAMYSKHCHGQKYYICSSRKRILPEKPICHNSRHYNGEVLENLVWKEFMKVFESPAILMHRITLRCNNRKNEKVKIEKRIRDLESDISAEENKKNRLVTAYTEGAITLSELKSQRDNIQRKIEYKISEKEKWNQKLSTTFEKIPTEINLESFSAKMKSLVRELDFSTKQRILRNFIQRITLNGDTANIRAVLPKELLVAPASTPCLLHGRRYDNGYPIEVNVRIPFRKVRKSYTATL